MMVESQPFTDADKEKIRKRYKLLNILILFILISAAIVSYFLLFRDYGLSDDDLLLVFIILCFVVVITIAMFFRKRMTISKDLSGGVKDVCVGPIVYKEIDLRHGRSISLNKDIDTTGRVSAGFFIIDNKVFHVPLSVYRKFNIGQIVRIESTPNSRLLLSVSEERNNPYPKDKDLTRK